MTPRLTRSRTAALRCDRNGSAQPGLARPSSEPPAVMGSNKGLTRRSVQEGNAVEVQWPSGARAMGCSFIGSYQSASGALPLCDPRPSGASGLFRASLRFSLERGGRGLINFETAFERGEMRPSLRGLGRNGFTAETLSQLGCHNVVLRQDE